MSMAEKLQESGGSFLTNLREAAAENPVAAALIGAGALWLLAGHPLASTTQTGVGAAAAAGRASAAAVGSQWRAARDGAADLAGGAADQVRQTVGAAADQMRQAMGEARQTSHDMSEDMADTARDGGSRLRQQGDSLREQGAGIGRRVADQFSASVDGFSSARAQLADLFERQPLALGAIGLAIGAAVAASLPTTRLEKDMLGETSDALRERARAAADVAAEEAQRQNLTPEGLKSDVADVVSKIPGAARGAAERAAETFRDRMSTSS